MPGREGKGGRRRSKSESAARRSRVSSADRGNTRDGPTSLELGILRFSGSVARLPLDAFNEKRPWLPSVSRSRKGPRRGSRGSFRAVPPRLRAQAIICITAARTRPVTNPSRRQALHAATGEIPRSTSSPSTRHRRSSRSSRKWAARSARRWRRSRSSASFRLRKTILRRLSEDG